MASVPEKIKRIRSMVNGYKLSRILMSAEALGIFQSLGSKPQALPALAEELDLPKERLRALLNALVQHEVLSADGPVYQIHPEMDLLNPAKPGAQNGYLRYAATVAERWADLSEAVQSASVAEQNFADITGDDRESAMAFASAMNANAMAPAKYISDTFVFDGHRILDIGAGAGTYPRTIGSKWSDARGTLLELPEMVSITEAFLSEEGAGLSDRFDVISGNYRKSIPKGPWNDVLLFAVIHQEEPAVVRALLSRIYDQLAPKGRLFLSSFFLDDDRLGPPFSTMFAVEMLVMVPTGTVYTFGETVDLLRGTGFADIEEHRDFPGPGTLYVATK